MFWSFNLSLGISATVWATFQNIGRNFCSIFWSHWSKMRCWSRNSKWSRWDTASKWTLTCTRLDPTLSLPSPHVCSGKSVYIYWQDVISYSGYGENKLECLFVAKILNLVRKTLCPIGCVLKMILIDDSSVINRWWVSLTDDARVIIYDRNLFKILATGLLLAQKILAGSKAINRLA